MIMDCHDDPFYYDKPCLRNYNDNDDIMTGPPRRLHLHEPALDGDLDVCGLCLHRRQHRPLPCQQVIMILIVIIMIHIFDARVSSKYIKL